MGTKEKGASAAGKGGRAEEERAGDKGQKRSRHGCHVATTVTANAETKPNVIWVYEKLFR